MNMTLRGKIMNVKAFIKTHSNAICCGFLLCLNLVLMNPSLAKEPLNEEDPYHLGYLGPFPSPIHIIGSPEETTSPFVGKIDTVIGVVDTTLACMSNLYPDTCKLVNIENFEHPRNHYIARQIMKMTGYTPEKMFEENPDTLEYYKQKGYVDFDFAVKIIFKDSNEATDGRLDPELLFAWYHYYKGKWELVYSATQSYEAAEYGFFYDELGNQVEYGSDIVFDEEIEDNVDQ